MRTARQAAFEALYKIFYENAFSNIVIDDCIKSLKDGKAFAARLAYGVTERQITLNYLIGIHCSKPKPKVKIILMMGVYQLYFMDKVPSSAAINESVELAKNNGLSYYSKLINAVLHNIDDNRINIDELDDLSLRYSVGKPLINMWIKQYGNEKTKSILESANGRPPVFAIPNPILTTPQSLAEILSAEGTDSDIDNGLVRINSAFDISASDAFKNGLFHIQDQSCYEAIKAFNIAPESTILDICSAPGGKAFTAAYFCLDNADIRAFDIHPHRVELIKKGADRLRLNSVKAQLNDATVYNPDIPLADFIICDVPCSGFGIIRRKPEIRYKELDSIKDLPELQFSILNVSAEYLKKGGKLLYSTCTLNRKENEKVVERFLMNNNAYSFVEEKTFLPDKNGGDGFFYSIIERI